MFPELSESVNTPYGQMGLADPEEIISTAHTSVSPSMKLVMGPVFWNPVTDRPGKVRSHECSKFGAGGLNLNAQPH